MRPSPKPKGPSSNCLFSFLWCHLQPSPHAILPGELFLHGKCDSGYCFSKLTVFRDQRGIQALRQRNVLRIVADNGVFRRHGKRRIYLHFASRHFDEAVGMAEQGPALRERQHFAPLIGCQHVQCFMQAQRRGAPIGIFPAQLLRNKRGSGSTFPFLTPENPTNIKQPHIVSRPVQPPGSPLALLAQAMNG